MAGEWCPPGWPRSRLAPAEQDVDQQRRRPAEPVGAVPGPGQRVEVLPQPGLRGQGRPCRRPARGQVGVAVLAEARGRPARWCSASWVRASSAAGRGAGRSGRSSAPAYARADPERVADAGCRAPARRPRAGRSGSTSGTSPETVRSLSGGRSATSRARNSPASALQSWSTRAAVSRAASARCPARVGADPAGQVGQGELRPGPQGVERRVDHAELALRADPVVVVAVVPVRQGQPDVAGVVLVGRPLARPGVLEVAPGVGVEQRQVGRHRVQRRVPGRRVVHPGLPGVHHRGQPGRADAAPPAQVVVLGDQAGVRPAGEGQARPRRARRPPRPRRWRGPAAG